MERRKCAFCYRLRLCVNQPTLNGDLPMCSACSDKLAVVADIVGGEDVREWVRVVRQPTHHELKMVINMEPL